MDFAYAELTRLNTRIGIALMSGKIEFDEISESVHRKVAEEICKKNEGERNHKRDCRTSPECYRSAENSD